MSCKGELELSEVSDPQYLYPDGAGDSGDPVKKGQMGICMTFNRRPYYHLSLLNKMFD